MPEMNERMKYWKYDVMKMTMTTGARTIFRLGRKMAKTIKTMKNSNISLCNMYFSGGDPGGSEGSTNPPLLEAGGLLCDFDPPPTFC